MALLRGKLFAGALFAGALFGAAQEQPAAMPARYAGGGGWHAPGKRKIISVYPVLVADSTLPVINVEFQAVIPINNDPVADSRKIKKRTRRQRDEEILFGV